MCSHNCVPNITLMLLLSITGQVLVVGLLHSSEVWLSNVKNAGYYSSMGIVVMQLA